MSPVKIIHEPPEILRHSSVVAELVLEPFQAAPQHRLIAVDHRLAECRFDRGYCLDLGRIGAAQEITSASGVSFSCASSSQRCGVTVSKSAGVLHFSATSLTTVKPAAVR